MGAVPNNYLATDLSVEDALPPGTTLCGGGIVLHETLGRGGFGITYRATDRRHNRDIAVKELFTPGCARRGRAVFPSAPSSEVAFRAARGRFEEQVRDLSNLRHANIVRVYELLDENDTVYIVMELLQGHSLQQIVEARRFLPESEALFYIRKLAAAIEAVHNLGLLHLDIKPENVVETRAGRVVLMDFDLIQKRHDGPEFETRPLDTPVHCGTPGYAPLEQYSHAAHFSPATDIYALGATLYHLVTGTVPPSPLEHALSDSPLPIPESVPPLMRSAIGKALQPHPELRPQRVREFLELLEPQRVVTVVSDTTRNGTRTRSTGILTAPPVAPSAPAAVAVAPAAMPSSPPAPSVHPPGFVPATAVPAAMQNRVWRVAVEPSATYHLQWPARCPCCGESCATNSFDFFEIGRGGRAWKVPHCHPCAQHTDATRTAAFVAAWGMTGGIITALIGLMEMNLILGPLGVFIHITAMSYGGLKSFAADALTKPECIDRKISVSCCGIRYFGGNPYEVFEFRRPDYADEFRKINSARWG